MTDATIARLDERTVERIAAGEVVERPASVVKELVENSLDAGAERVEVTVEGDGTDRIAVADDGVGMGETDVRRAIEQHTTSKIRDIADLDRGVATLGFRGEALYTIGAVSRMTITTRPLDGGDVGTELRVVGGQVDSIGPAGRRPGTTVAVEDLFFNTPARRKYLKTAATEFGHVNRVVTRYALANPDVAVTLEHDGSRVFATTGRDDVRATMLAVYGREVAESMIDVDHEAAAARVHGYVSDPETTRSAREYVSTFVNGRYVRDGGLRKAILEGYGKQLAVDRYPFAVLFVEVPPDSVDVNVHPRKMEVRFDDDAAVHEAIESAVQSALLDHGLIRTRAPRGRSAPDDAPVAPEGDSTDGDPADDDAPTPEDAVRDADSLDGMAGTDEGDRRAWDSAEDGATGSTANTGAAADTGSTAKSGSASDADSGPSSASGDGTATTRPGTGGPGSDDGSSTPDHPRPPVDPDRKFGGVHDQPTLTDVEAETDFETLPPLRVLGQLKDTYVVAESPDGLVLIDQHAADERINYERLTGRLAADGTVQTLVSAVELELTAHEASVFDEALADLRAAGFEAHREDRTAVVEAVPAVFGGALDPDVLRDVLASFLDGDAVDLVDSAADALLADLACYPSITGNTSLTEGDVLDLLSRLDRCDDPWSCPHGRPVVIELGADELADRFERDYPGHAVRRPEE